MEQDQVQEQNVNENLDQGNQKDADFSAKITEMQAQLQSLAQENSSLKEKHGTVIAENKKYRSRYQEAVSEKEDREKADLESKGKFQEALEMERANMAKLKGELKTIKNQSVLNSVNFEVARFAPDAHDVNDVIGALDIKEDEIDWDKASVNGISNKIDVLRKNKGYLFKTNAPGMETKTPGYQEPKQKPLSELSASEVDKQLTELLRQ